MSRLANIIYCEIPTPLTPGPTVALRRSKHVVVVSAGASVSGYYPATGCSRWTMLWT